MSKKTVDLKQIQKQLYEKLKPSGWADVLKTFVMGDEFLDILKTLWAENQDGQHFTPGLKQIFRAFEECPYDQLKVVVLGQDPYAHAGVADGIAFSCGNTDKIEPTLNYIFKEIGDTVYKGEYGGDKNLDRWSNQGMLLLNLTLTTHVGTPGMHHTLWAPFLAHVLDQLAFKHMGLVYMFMGNKAKAWAKSVPQSNYKFITTHPISAASSQKDHWDSGNVFNQINVVLKQQYDTEIIW